jgi:methylmalonyl-CoA mutase N-terminal domain/subunit
MTADSNEREQSLGPRDALDPVMTEAGIEVAPLYDGDSLRSGLADRLGAPGEPPFTRGPYPTMYRERPWTMRQYAGYGSPEDANARYRFLLDQGQTALSIAFDLPTQLGYDSDHEMAEAEVGRVGVAIDTVEDMVALFDGLPLDKLSVNFTINATAPIIAAMYVVAGERQGVDPADLTGTIQNDILKEFLARKTFLFPPAPSMRLACDVVEWSATNLPRFNPISVTGYHAREAGCDAVQELAFAMAEVIAYSSELVARGLDFDSFAPRLSFHFATTLDLFEEAAKLRAARRAWYRIATERFGSDSEASGRLRFFSGCSGATLTAQQPLNNVVRSTIQCLGAVLGGAQSIHVMGFDEALEIPSEEAVTLALRTQQIVAHESGVTRTIDPLAGSYYVEWLTDEIEARAMELVEQIDALGGMVEAVAEGLPQRWIADRAYATEQQISDGTQVKVGVNRWADEQPQEELRLFEVDESSRARQIARQHAAIAARDGDAAVAALAALRTATVEGVNVMPALLDAVRSGCSIGECSDVFRDIFGDYREPVPW